MSAEKKHKATWIHPQSKHWHLLDYVLVKAVDLIYAHVEPIINSLLLQEEAGF